MIGIIPAAGKAERMNGLPKMLLPIPGGILIHTVLTRMQSVPVEAAYVLPGDSTFRLLAYLENNEAVKVWGVGDTGTMSETLTVFSGYYHHNHAHDNVLFGMPDTYFEDADAFIKLASALNEGADVAVGVFETRPEQRSKMGMCLTAAGAVIDVKDKPATTSYTWGWGVLAWKPVFWEYIDATDPHVGYALPKAIAAGLDVRAVFMDGQYFDAGTPEEYFDLICHLHRQKAAV